MIQSREFHLSTMSIYQRIARSTRSKQRFHTFDEPCATCQLCLVPRTIYVSVAYIGCIQLRHTPGGRWKAAQEGGAAGAVANLTLKDKHGEVIEKQLPGGKVKKKAKNEVVLETNTRSKKKCVTTILGAVGRPSASILYDLLCLAHRLHA